MHGSTAHGRAHLLEAPLVGEESYGLGKVFPERRWHSPAHTRGVLAVPAHMWGAWQSLHTRGGSGSPCTHEGRSGNWERTLALPAGPGKHAKPVCSSRVLIRVLRWVAVCAQHLGHPGWLQPCQTTGCRARPPTKPAPSLTVVMLSADMCVGQLCREQRQQQAGAGCRGAHMP